MSMIRGSLTHTNIRNLIDDDISERSLNYSFLREFLESSDEEQEPKWIEFVSIQLGYENSQPKDKLLTEIDKLIKTATYSKKFGL